MAVRRKLLCVCAGLSTFGVLACSNLWGFETLTGSESDAGHDEGGADSGIDAGTPDAGSDGGLDTGDASVVCTPSGTRQPFNTVVSSTVTGCYSAGNPCVKDTVVFSPTNGRNFQAIGQEIVCGGTTACVGHVSVGTQQDSTVCQGTWDVYCNATMVGSINTLGKACAGTAMTNGCGITFAPTQCTTLRFVATAGSGAQCCGGAGPDSTLVAISAW